MLIKKKDGQVVRFKEEKLVDAMTLAGASEHVIYNVLEEVYDELAGKDVTSVLEVIKLVENGLMQFDPESARNYIEYRSMRDRERNSGTDLMKAISSVINADDPILMTENANVASTTFGGNRHLIVSEVCKELAKSILPKEIWEAHRDGILHYHDLTNAPALPQVNCCLVDVRGMFEHGFTLGSAAIQRPRSVGVSANIIAQIVNQVSSANYGGTTVDHIDSLLVPYITMSYNKHFANALKYGIQSPETYAMELTEKEVEDAAQSLEYEVNSLINASAQVPFVTVAFGMETSWQGRLVQKAILHQRMRGLGNGVTAIFPKLNFYVEEGLNLKPEDPNYDIKRLALQCMTKAMYPDIISVKNIKKITGFSKPISSMGCRSFLSVWKNSKGIEESDGRNNLGVVSINLPRIALESQSVDDFFERLDERLDLCHVALRHRFDTAIKARPDNAPLIYKEGAFGHKLKSEDSVKDLYENSRASLSLGYIGIHHVVTHLLGIDKMIHNTEAEELGLEIVSYLRKKVDKWKEEENIGYSLYSTPSEGLCDRFLRLDKKQFGIVKNVTDREYYINSFHLDPREDVTPFERIDFEYRYQYIATGGFITYTELPKMINNIKGLEKIVDYGVSKCGYFACNQPIDKCLACGSTDELKPTATGYICTKCGCTDVTKLHAIRRVSGYLSEPVQRPVNNGKSHEYMERVKNSVQ